MPPRRAEDVPVKRAAAAGCKLPMQLPAGEILTDITQNKWKLGNTIGYGGFGDIYLASNDITSSVGQDAKYVVKIEPHNNGPLFVEMNFYIRAARKHMIESWCKSQGKRRIGVPTYEGSGSHIYGGQRYRFLVIPRYGIDIGKLFLSYRRKFPTKLVNTLAVQMLDALEYIHSKGYAHADIKGPNILLSYGDNISEAYLVDYGLAYRFRTGTGGHKPFVHDERRAHEGTLEFTSRDAHHGTHSRRGDLETLGYNIIQWLCGKLPWEKDSDEISLIMDPEEVHQQKETLLSDLSLFMDKCFPHKKKPPAAVMKYMEYVAELEFETKPNYFYLRNLFLHQDGNIPTCLYNMKESSENLTTSIFFERPYLRERKPCRPVNGEIRITRNTQPKRPVQKKEFSWEAVLALHPDKLAKISTQPLYASTQSTPLTPPITPPSPSSLSPRRSPSLPTYAMLDVLRRMKERQSSSFRHKATPKSSDNELKPKWMTPAMEEIARLRKKITESVPILNLQSPRVTRSRVAKLKRFGTNQQHKQIKDDSTDSKVTHKRRKGSSS
ncbi:serine/threonine-protein kinase VRK1-like [Linepithema humile]|uniref:serine/threonine-protein kinase VRK1-like n=1 Tax=Linepithema humile TaxID=83485 RepID=UPI00062394A4|nr:PREDICTED: serine/threonine-protein kinase VRK1-like isoform X2 [Linepithema humile]XP_012234534.1 PREDICTED: serine/threonine-protein kinase VRK1-like isoform X2 [Linepithema humile]XP_012234535.1 PREDICTED: serine/threonine-protein kinase VRK1-like isoform X2 [Linepithema humile]XP_012234536.1 PREDICTED: serine/threonine-protein kinase VRK1-like isoform X2 [Linepithema humile]